MDTAQIDQTSEQFLGQWKRLVSTTNWEKGRIIHDWRQALVDRGAGSAEYSDDAWARRVGNVTAQHVGRLRRVHERFGAVRDEYPGLFWSHFQAGLDWHDAEMWLEGAVQSDWSVAQMRRQRWEALGAPAELQPRDEDIVVSEIDEDVDPAVDDEPLRATPSIAVDDDRYRAAVVGEDAAAKPEADEIDPEEVSRGDAGEDRATDQREASRPFANLPALPPDVSEAFEAFKLCILRHKLAAWQEMAQDDLVATLDALRELALAPAGG